MLTTAKLVARNRKAARVRAKMAKFRSEMGVARTLARTPKAPRIKKRVLPRF